MGVIRKVYLSMDNKNLVSGLVVFEGTSNTLRVSKHRFGERTSPSVSSTDTGT